MLMGIDRGQKSNQVIYGRPLLSYNENILLDIVKDIPGKSYDLEERQVLDEGCCGNCKNNQGVP